MTLENTYPKSRTEARDLEAERRMIHRMLRSMLIVIPLCAGFFALLVFIATRLGGVPSGTPVLMGLGTGVLAGVFFGLWAGVVASVHDVEQIELAPVPGRGDDVTD